MWFKRKDVGLIRCSFVMAVDLSLEACQYGIFTSKLWIEGDEKLTTSTYLSSNSPFSNPCGITYSLARTRGMSHQLISPSSRPSSLVVFWNTYPNTPVPLITDWRSLTAVLLGGYHEPSILAGPPTSSCDFAVETIDRRLENMSCHVNTSMTSRYIVVVTMQTQDRRRSGLHRTVGSRERESGGSAIEVQYSPSGVEVSL